MKRNWYFDFVNIV